MLRWELHYFRQSFVLGQMHVDTPRFADLTHAPSGTSYSKPQASINVVRSSQVVAFPPTVRLFTSRIAPAGYDALVPQAFLTDEIKKLGILECRVTNIEQRLQLCVKNKIISNI